MVVWHQHTDSWVCIRTASKFSLHVFVQGRTLGRLDEISIEWYNNIIILHACMMTFLFSGAWPGSREMGFSGRKSPLCWSCSNVEILEYSRTPLTWTWLTRTPLYLKPTPLALVFQSFTIGYSNPHYLKLHFCFPWEFKLAGFYSNCNYFNYLILTDFHEY